tara:strand:+ start:15905 stop:16978 length:1074 start_codon:yes stop_codon:yes gene_type:complete
MKTYIQNIELINQYIHQRLSDSEVLTFESRIESDEKFKKLYDEHFIFLEGLKRITLRQEIQKAYRLYVMHKWIKIAGVSILILGLLVLGYILFSNQKTETNVESFKERSSSFMILDSSANKTREIMVSSSDSMEVSQISRIKKDTITVVQSPPDNKEKDMNVFSGIRINNKRDQEQESYEKTKMNTLSDELQYSEEETNERNDIVVDPELNFETDNSFKYNGKEYRLENCDIANESYGEISKWEIDLFCCGNKFYYSNKNKKEIDTLLYFSLKALETGELSEGSYRCTNVNTTEGAPFTFTGEIKVGTQIVKISEGEIKVEYDDDSDIQISFNLKLNSTQTVTGKYSGEYNFIINKK